MPGYKSTLAGHPLHPQLIVAPAGLLPFSFVMDVMHLTTGDASYAQAGYHCMWGGYIGALAAASAGAVDYFAIPNDSHTKKIANIHAGLNAGLILLYTANLVIRKANDRKPSTVSTILSAIGADGLLVSAWYGGHMVYEHGMRVKEESEVEGAKSVRPLGDEALELAFQRLESTVTGGSEG